MANSGSAMDYVYIACVVLTGDDCGHERGETNPPLHRPKRRTFVACNHKQSLSLSEKALETTSNLAAKT
jgi:hypothetical protein